MKQLQILLADGLRALRRRWKRVRPARRDAIFKMAGADSFEPVPPDEIDAVVYGDP